MLEPLSNRPKQGDSRTVHAPNIQRLPKKQTDRTGFLLRLTNGGPYANGCVGPFVSCSFAVTSRMIFRWNFLRNPTKVAG
jgi:hypothetical protein